MFTDERLTVKADVPRFLAFCLLLSDLFSTLFAVSVGAGGGAGGGGGGGGVGILGLEHIVKPWLGCFRFGVYFGRLEIGLQSAVRNKTSAHFEPSHNQNRPVRGKLLLTY